MPGNRLDPQLIKQGSYAVLSRSGVKYRIPLGKSNITMKPSLIKQEVLGSAVEDYHNLYEIIWGLRSLLPDKTEAELRQFAEREIRELLEKGHVALYRRTGSAGEAILLQPNKVEAALADETSWKVPPEADSEETLVGATDLGEAEYYSGSPE
jgi:hypothetical protein